MPEVAFASSEPLTLGIEEEFLLLDETAQVALRADALLDGGWETVPSPGGWYKPELLRCTIELATAASRELAQLEVDLAALRRELVRRASGAGLRVIALGLHPDLVVTRAHVSPTSSHGVIADLHERVGTLGEQSTHGMHVHVGMPSLEDAIRVTDALAAYAPLFIACAAHSPVAHGQRSPWRSVRADVLARMLWAGPTPRLTSADEYRAIHALHQLENSGEQRFLWDVAPVPQLGTVEVRAFDSQPDATLTLALAALVQGIAAHVLAGGSVARAHESLERHNRWSAMEFGLRGRFLVAGRSEPVDVVELMRDAVALARPHARELGNEAWLAPLELLANDSPAEQAIAAFDAGGMSALLAHAELHASDEP